MIDGEMLGLLAGLLLTLFIYSYLLGDNWFYRLAVHILVGVSAAYAAVVATEEIIIPVFRQLQADPTAPDNLLWAIPLLLALLLLFTWSRRTSWMTSSSVALLVGTGAAVALVGAVSGTVLPQLRATPSTDPILQVVVALLTIIVLLYFQFSGRPSGEEARWQTARRALSGSGRALLMITFGALFAGAFTTSLILLTDRLSYLARGILEFVDIFLP